MFNQELKKIVTINDKKTNIAKTLEALLDHAQSSILLN